MVLNKEKINNFFEVLDYLEKNQKGVFGIGGLNKFQLQFYTYLDDGEGMGFITAEQHNLKELKEELIKKLQRF